MRNFEFKDGNEVAPTRRNPKFENQFNQRNGNGFFNFDNSKIPFDVQQQSKTVYRCECGAPVSRDNQIFNRKLCNNCITARNSAKMRIAPPTETATGKIYRLLVCHGCSGVFGEAKMQSAQLCKKCDSIKLRKINLLKVVSSFISRGVANNGTR